MCRFLYVSPCISSVCNEKRYNSRARRKPSISRGGAMHNAPIFLLLLVLREPPFSVPIESPISDGLEAAFSGYFVHSGGDVLSPSVAAIPPYAFEIDTAGTSVRSTVGDGTNDTVIMEGVKYEKEN